MKLKLTDKQLKNFWKKVDKNGEGGCWLWLAGKKGYGRFTINKKMYLAHRVSFLLFNGEFPKDCCCHRCDIKACVNPNHLFDATQADNMKDKVAKGRQDKGEKHGRVKLTEQQVLEIRENYISIPRKSNSKYFQEKYGINHQTISSIILRKTWKHI